MPQEATKTVKARQKIIELYKQQGYEVTEEVPYLCRNNMGELILPPYQADILLKKEFIVELDPYKLHGTKIKRSHDKWRDKNIEREYNIKTVRLDPKDILKQDPIDTILEVDSQLLCRNNKEDK